jgi:hypothetical protein
MDAGSTVSLTGSLFTLALVLLVVAGMARSGSLARNGAVGIRTRSTTASDQAWVAGHRAAYGALRATGWLSLGFGALSLLLSVLVHGAAAMPIVLGTAGLGYAALVAGLVVSTRRANRAARSAPPHS